MFEVQTGNGKSYDNVAVSTSNADRAIHKFIAVCDMYPAARIVRDGKVMARLTAKGAFIAPEWRR